MNEKKKNVPQLRFPGFTDAWEQRKVLSLADNTYGGGTPKTSIPEYWSGDIPWIQSSDLSEGKLFDVLVKKHITNIAVIKSAAKIIPSNSIAIVTRVGVGKLAFISHEYSTSQDFLSLSNLQVDGRFGVYSLYRKINSELNEVQGTAIKGVTKTELLKKSLRIPKNHKEQQKIGTFFQQLDNLITLHQRKLSDLKKLKNGLLQKMFPKNGEKYPEIRFPEFTDAWEQRKLGEVADILGGGTPSTGVSGYWDGDIDWYSPNELGNEIYLHASKRKITKLGLQKSSAQLLPLGTVLFTSRAGIGNTAILEKEGATNQGFQSIVPHKDQLDNYFIFSQSPTLKRYGETTGAGSTFIEVSGKQMRQMNLTIPSIEEQQKIGTFFQLLDNLITLHQRELDHLQLQKKALLQQMFV
ncbi:restriction endonuclease subunit S [Lapidilactobacillus luobeiensis]|uniref:restriction endonuclease subunit S n=1 Tax=Lapidilactobacillus luobeiensis TaxID=2950371 RepID=UPI0021C2844A|nr:restriction endonuclease subunit S [Lapidilactobacillus luobeiensis]